MKANIVFLVGFIATTLVAGCAGAGSQNFASNTSDDEHTTAATGFGLGPEYYRTNGGAFGPDQVDR